MRSRRALAASSFMCSIEWPALVGLWSSEGTSSVATADGSSSGVETGREVVIRFSGIVGEGLAESNEEPLDIRRGAIFESAKSALAERLWLIARCPLSMLSLRDATMLLADCPRPCGCGRVTNGEGSNGVPRSNDMDAC